MKLDGTKYCIKINLTPEFETISLSTQFISLKVHAKFKTEVKLQNIMVECAVYLFPYLTWVNFRRAIQNLKSN